MNQGGAAEQPPAGKILVKKYVNWKDVVNQVNILCQVQVAGKYGFEICDTCANKLNCQWFYSFLL